MTFAGLVGVGMVIAVAYLAAIAALMALTSPDIYRPIANGGWLEAQRRHRRIFRAVWSQDCLRGARWATRTLVYGSRLLFFAGLAVFAAAAWFAVFCK